ncbi:MAG: hypothetical protein JO295_03070 [Verrucomicrobia bacterium]|nr:hypothetical protein [Verrucomicrobiota bacterium]
MKSFAIFPFTKSRLAWTILVSAALALALTWALNATRSPFDFYFEVTLRTSASSVAQIFYDVGRGINEADSVRVPIHGGDVAARYRFPLPAGEYQWLRFDPTERGGARIALSEARIVDRAGRVVRTFPPANFHPSQQIAAAAIDEHEAAFTTLPGDTDPVLAVDIGEPFTLQSSSGPDFGDATRHFLAAFVLSFTLAALAPPALGLLQFCRNRSLPPKLIAWLDGPSSWSRPYFVPIDRFCYVFLGGCVLFFGTLAAAGLHGSSASMWTHYGFGDASHEPLLGKPKDIRSDEWHLHTAVIFNQLLRSTPLAVEPSAAGAGQSALLANVPVRHASALVRPQFWPFHLAAIGWLSPGRAFAWYWQAKGLLLVSGVFVLLIVVGNGRSAAAAVGALWYFFSAATQWTYSWPSLLPEMVGLLGWLMALGAYLSVGHHPGRLALAGALWLGAALNFAFCIYPPHQLPLGLAGGCLGLGWIWTRRRDVCQAPRVRLIVGGSVLLLMLLGLGGFLWSARATFVAAAATIYPGHRSVGGGSVPVAELASHFMDFWKKDDSASVPPALLNVCEASGYLWLAPMTVFMVRQRAALSVRSQALLPALWVAAGLLAAWMLLPIPASVGRWVLFDRVVPGRCMPALGLLNVAIVMLHFSRQQPAAVARSATAAPVSAVGRFFWWFPNSLVVFLAILSAANLTFSKFFPDTVVWVGAAAGAFLTASLAMAWTRTFTLALLVPLIWVNGLINPVDSGFHAIWDSPLYRMVGQHPEWRQAKWLVFTPGGAGLSGYMLSMGLEVEDFWRIVPDFKLETQFDPKGEYRDIYNQSGYLLASPLLAGEASRFKNETGGMVTWYVSPCDPRLARIGVRYIASDQELPPEITAQLKPLLDPPLPNVWLWELPPPASSSGKIGLDAKADMVGGNVEN